MLHRADGQALKIALVHHWLTSPGGGEKVLLELHKMFPDAPIFTSSYIPEKFPEYKDTVVQASILAKIPVLQRRHQFYPLFFGRPFHSFDFSEYDLVISSDAADARNIQTGANTLHICYCHTPVRYYWSDHEWMLKNKPFGLLNPVAHVVFKALIGALRKNDFAAAQRVNVFIANSRHIQARIKRYYQRDSTVIYPPIAAQPLLNKARDPKDYYVIVGRQVASKRLDIAVDAFNELGLPLKVAGSGDEVARQAPRAKANIEFLGRVSDEQRDTLMSQAKAFIFPPEEDFGIAPLEAMAAGCPVIAFNGGGAPEYVEDGKTGVLFPHQDAASLQEAVHRFETMDFDDRILRAKAMTYDAAVFRATLSDFAQQQWDEFEQQLHNLK